MMTRDYQTLDAIVVCAAMAEVLFVLVALVFVKIPEPQLPIISGLGGTVLGVILTYAAFRWQGVSDKGHAVAPGTAEVSIKATTGDVQPDEAAKGSEQ